MEYLDGHSFLSPSATVHQSLFVLGAEDPHGYILHALTDRLLGSHREVECILLAVKCLLPWTPGKPLQITISCTSSLYAAPDGKQIVPCQSSVFELLGSRASFSRWRTVKMSQGFAHSLELVPASRHRNLIIILQEELLFLEGQAKGDRISISAFERQSAPIFHRSFAFAGCSGFDKLG